MVDSLSPEQRSRQMAKVKSTSNKSTEGKVAGVLTEKGISGWVSHPNNIPGRPDFYFPIQHLAIFVDGCFWHGCKKCGRIPKSRVAFWVDKISSNRKRDIRVRRSLREANYKVITIWEHSLKQADWVRRVRAALDMANRDRESLFPKHYENTVS